MKLPELRKVNKGSPAWRVGRIAALWAALGLAQLGTGCLPPAVIPPPAPEDSAEAREQLQRALSTYWSAMIPRRPRIAMAVGRRVDVMPTPALAASNQEASQLLARRLGRTLDRIDAAALTPRDYATLQTLRWELEMEAEGGTFTALDFSILSPSASSLREGLDVLLEHPFAAPADLDRYLFLLDGLSLWMTDARGSLDDRLSRGIVASRDAVDSFRAFLRHFRGLVQAGALAVAPARLARLDTTLVHAFRDQEGEGLGTRLLPAIDSLSAHLEAYGRGTRERPGLWQYPGGKEYYRHLLRRRLGLEVEPEEAHEAALRQLRRVDSLLTVVLGRMRVTGTMRLDSLRALPRVAPVAVDSIVQRMRSHHQLVRDTVRTRIAAVPDTVPTVRAATPLEALLDPEGRVRPPEYADSTATLVVTPWWGSTTALLEGPARAFAWGWPGRTLAATVSYGAGVMNPVVLLHPSLATEAGWAEYAASLGGELGFYADPMATWGRLMQEGLNAAWLLVDTGVHYYGWTKGQALQALRPFSAATPAELDSMLVARVVQSPGAAGAAAIGAREVAAMRTWMQSLLGKEFSAPAWHQELLTLGPVPLPVLAAHLEWWGWEVRRRVAAAEAASRRRKE